MKVTAALPKTGTRSRGSVVPKFQNTDTKPLKEGSGAPSSADSRAFREITQENGVRVSVNGKDAPAGGYLEDSEMNGVSSLLKMRGTQEEVGRGDENGCAMEKNGEDKVTGDDLPEEGSISVVTSGAQVGVEESRDCGERENSDDYFNAKENYGEMSEGDDEDGEEIDVDDDDDEEEGGKFKLGDFVWGKIRSHPWWPGRIYDPSDASGYALKIKRRNKILVAYFGDGTFAWCKPSQLKPFNEEFKKISRQKCSKNFIHAVRAALDEISQLVEMKLVSSLMKEGYTGGRCRLLAVNSGIKEGVFVPEGGIEKYITDFFQPAEFLTHMKLIAQVGNAKSLLEFAVFKGWLSAFYGEKGFCQCPVFRERQLIPGLEDKMKNSAVDKINDGELQVCIPGPVEEDRPSLPGGPRFGQTKQTLLQKCPTVSDGQHHHRRKQKSIAEIIGMNVETEDVEREFAKKTDLDKPALTSKMKKWKDGDEGDSDDTDNSASIRRRKRKATKLSEALLATESKLSNFDHDGSGSNEGTLHPSLSTVRKKKSRFKNDGGGSKKGTNANHISTEEETSGRLGVGSDLALAKEEIEMASSPRERKRSKYVSPPYTNLNQGQRKKGREADSLKVLEEEQVGERMNRAASHLIEFPPIMKCSGDNQENLFKGGDLASPQSSNQVQCNIIDPRSVNISTNEVLSGIQYVALRAQHRKENKSLDSDMVYQFFSAFRSSVFHDGSNYHDYKNLQPGMKRKAQGSGPDTSGNFQNESDLSSPENESQKRTGLAKSKSGKKPAASLADVERNEKESDVKASSAVLFVTFGQGSTLPSKNDLIRIYGKFGALNKELTDVLRDDFCARVVFVNASDAEAALNSSQLVSPFGADTGTFQLCYLSPDLNEEGACEADVKTKEKESDGERQSSNLVDMMTSEKPHEEDSGAALFVSFGPGSFIPSKKDLINIYRKYGVLSEGETDMFYPNFCARIVFVRTSDGEAALKRSQLVSPFGSSRVTFRLLYLSSASRAKELMEIPSAKISPSLQTGVKTRDTPTPSESRLNYIRQKLQLMMSILEKSDERSYQETKSRMEGEIKGLLEKVSTMEGSSSS